MSAILDLSNDITLGKSLLIRSATSVGGYTRTQRGGPTLLSISASYPIINETDHGMLQAELQSIDEGISFLMTNIPEVAKLALFQGSLNFTTGTHIDVTDINTEGSRVQLVNLTAGDNVKAGDFIQFNSNDPDATHDKIYQIKSDATVNNVGEMNITLNMGVVRDLTSATTVRTGSNCIGKFIVSNDISVTAIPKNANENNYQYSDITLRETL